MIDTMAISTPMGTAVLRFPESSVVRLRPPRQSTYDWAALAADLASFYHAGAELGQAMLSNSGDVTIMNPRYDFLSGIPSIVHFGLRRGVKLRELRPVWWLEPPLDGIAFSGLKGGTLTAFMVQGADVETLVSYIWERAVPSVVRALDAMYEAVVPDCFGVLAEYMSPQIFWGIRWRERPNAILQSALHIVAGTVDYICNDSDIPNLKARYSAYVRSIVARPYFYTGPVVVFVEHHRFGNFRLSAQNAGRAQWVVVTSDRINGAEDVEISVTPP